MARRRAKKIREAKAAGATNGQVAQKGNGKISVDPRSSILEQVSKAPGKPENGLVVAVNFSMHPDLLAGLDGLSRAEFRSMEGEILSLVARAVKQHSEDRPL